MKKYLITAFGFFLCFSSVWLGCWLYYALLDIFQLAVVVSSLLLFVIGGLIVLSFLDCSGGAS